MYISATTATSIVRMSKNDGQRCHRCANCDFDWPYTTDYTTCPICATDTYSTTSTEVLTYTQAKEVIKVYEEQIARRAEIERKMDEALVASAIATLDEELGSLLC